ncbi:HAD family phosphatase [soil metagenome]
MNQHDIKLIVFDMGHVFVDFEWETVCQGFYSRAGITKEQFQPILKHVGSLGYESGHIDTSIFLKAINEQMANHGDMQTIGEEEFHQLWNATFRENIEMANLMEELRKQHKLYLLSNTNESHWQYLDQTFKVSRHFEELILSYKVGHIKPQHEIYQEVLRRSNLAAQHCLFIDDLEPNIAAGSAVGMNVVHFKDISDLQSRFEHFGISTN